MKKTNNPACKLCGKAVVKKVHWQEYCSAKCRHLAWAKKQLEKI